MNTNKSIFISQHIMAINLADIYNDEKKEKLLLTRLDKTKLPAPWTIFEKDIVLDQGKPKDFNTCGLSQFNSSSTNGLSQFNSSSSSSPVLLNFNSQNNVTAENGKMFRKKDRSRFFSYSKDSTKDNSIVSTNSNNNDSIEVPDFVSFLVSKNTSRYSFFKKLIKDDQDLTYFDRTLIREYSDNNPWATFILAYSNYKNNLLENNEFNLLNKFKSV